MNGDQTETALLARWPNFRDLGGVPAAGGRQVRRGRFFRAPALSRLRDEETERLLTLDPALIVDFRSPAEVEEIPVELPAPLAERRINLAIPPLVDERFRKLFAEEKLRHDAVAEAMAEAYRDFVRVYSDIYARFLSATDAAGDRAVIFHCTAGKDRTGFAAALVLKALGAPGPEVERDYLATGALWRPDRILEERMPVSARAAIFGVAPGYLRAGLEELEAAHGGAEAFAEAALGGAERYRAWVSRHTG